MASTKISDLIAQPDVQSSDEFVIVRNSTNYKVQFSTFATALGTTGTLTPNTGGTPVLTQPQAGENNIRSLADGHGIQVSLDVNDNLQIGTNFANTSGDGVTLAVDFNQSQIAWRKLQSGAGIDITPDADGNAVISNLAESTEGLLSKISNSTETQIAIVSTPVRVNVGSVVTELATNFTSDGQGRLTYNDVNTTKVDISAALSLRAASSGAKNFIVYIAINGSVVPASRQRIATDLVLVSANVIWRAELSLNDYVEIFVSNETDTDNCLVSDYQLRVS